MVQIFPQSYVFSQLPMQVGIQTRSIASRAMQALPSSDDTKEQLATVLGVQQGLKCGLIFSAIACLPIYWLEKKTKSPTILQKSIRILKTLVHSSSQKTGLYSEKVNPPTFLSSITGTMLIGLLAGSTLGAWITRHARKRLISIQKAEEAQKQGTFVPQKPTLLQQLGLADKPIQDPEQDLKHMMDTEFNPKHAFVQGATTVLFLKVIPSAILMLSFLLITKYMPQKVASRINERLSVFLKASVHPVMVAKLVALPLMGGFIARSLAPWMKSQLGLTDTVVD